MVNPTPMRAIAITCIKWFVMYKSVKIFIDFISYHYFFGMSIDNFTACIRRKASFETGCTVAIVFNTTTPTINPINTIGTSVATAVRYTFIGFALGTCTAIWFNASFAATVSFTFIGFALDACTAIRFNTSVAAAVCYTFIGFADGTCTAIRVITSVATAVCYTFIGFALGTCTAIRFITSFATAVSFAFICFISGACFTIRFNT
jgi:hypothetical protein